MTEPTTRRPRSDGVRSRQTILRAAANLATVDGLEGISIGNLAAHIGMSKSGLYAHFGSKEDLQLATVDTALEIFATEVVGPAVQVEDPLQRVRTFCDRFLSYVERRVFPGGCFFVSVQVEFNTHPGPVRDKIAAIQRAWFEQLEGMVAAAQASGALRADEDPAQLAFDLTSAMMLGDAGFVLHDDPAFLHRARAAIEQRLELARP